MAHFEEFYDQWARAQHPTLHFSPSLPDGFLFRSIKDAWFENAEHAVVEVGQTILVREIVKDNIIIQYGSERTEEGWTRHIVAFRQGEESPFPLTHSVPSSS
jgi:hypothetical protein